MLHIHFELDFFLFILTMTIGVILVAIFALREEVFNKKTWWLLILGLLSMGFSMVQAAVISNTF